MRAVLAVFVVLAWIGEAAAMMAPDVYEKARKEAPNVVVIAVGTVPPPATDFGMCRVTGTIEAVERGTRFAAGGAISLDVPCAKPGANYPDGGTIWQDMATLVGSARGSAWLDADGAIVLSQYRIHE